MRVLRMDFQNNTMRVLSTRPTDAIHLRLRTIGGSELRMLTSGVDSFFCVLSLPLRTIHYRQRR